jgi:hypothetical protein
LNLDPDGQYQQISLESQDAILKRPVVVRLFDGIAAGLVAQRSLGIIPKIYYSSEIDEFALKIQRLILGERLICWAMFVSWIMRV